MNNLSNLSDNIGGNVPGFALDNIPAPSQEAVDQVTVIIAKALGIAIVVGGGALAASYLMNNCTTFEGEHKDTKIKITK